MTENKQALSKSSCNIESNNSMKGEIIKGNNEEKR